MKHRSFWYALWSQACLLIGILLCLLIRPHQAALNYPISYFGNFRNTIAPYVAGFLGGAYWLVRTALILPRNLRPVRVLALLVVACMLGVLCTPYMISSTVGFMHLSFAVSLLALDLTLSVLLIIRSHHMYPVVGFAIQLTGAVFSVLSQLGIVHVELIAELAVIVGFGVLFSCTLSQLVDDAGRPENVE